MIDARTWSRPSPQEVRSLIQATGLSQRELGRRLGVGERRVRHWLAPGETSKSKRITYVEYLALRQLTSHAEST